MGLADRSCQPLPAGTPPLDPTRAAGLLREVRGWEREGERLRRRFTFADFAAAMRFANAVAAVAEREQHHPDILVHDWNRVDVTTWTHSVGGLSENDFVLAAKIDLIQGATPPAG